MNDCERYIPMISALVDGELDIAEKADLRSHLACCEDCAALYRFYSEVSLAMEEDMAEPPAALRQNVMDAVSKKRVKKRPGAKRYAGYLAAAACFVVIVAVAPRLSGLGCGSSGGSAPAAPMAEESYAPAYDSPAAYAVPSSAPDTGSAASGASADGGDVREEYGARSESFDLYAAGTEEVTESSAEAEVPMEAAADEPSAAAADGAEGASAASDSAAASDGMASNGAALGFDYEDYADEFAVYYSVVRFRGELPELLAGVEFSQREYGSVCEVSPATAEELARQGYEIAYFNEDAEVSLVLFKP